MGEHQNNIGVMRLALASAVIVGHAPEMLDGNRSRELLGTLSPYTSLGTFAVTGFFLLSGYLITGSMLKKASLWPYLSHRMLRILPGYCVAFVLSVFVLGPLLGINIRPYVREAFVNLIYLKAVPAMPEQIHRTYPSLNGALWTIAYEFRCYLAVAVFWRLGLLNRRRIVVAITAALLLGSLAAGFESIATPLSRLDQIRKVEHHFGQPIPSIVFTATFFVGASFYLYRDILIPRLSGRMVIISLALLGIGSQFAVTAQVARAMMVVPIFWLAFSASLGPLQRINDRWDVSYGTYLYGTPILMTFILLWPMVSLGALIAVSLPLAWIVGLCSWFLVEKPAMQLRSAITNRRSPYASTRGN